MSKYTSRQNSNEINVVKLPKIQFIKLNQYNNPNFNEKKNKNHKNQFIFSAVIQKKSSVQKKKYITMISKEIDYSTGSSNNSLSLNSIRLYKNNSMKNFSQNHNYKLNNSHPPTKLKKINYNSFFSSKIKDEPKGKLFCYINNVPQTNLKHINNLKEISSYKLKKPMELDNICIDNKSIRKSLGDYIFKNKMIRNSFIQKRKYIL